jgi:hypothetical protein
MAGKKAKIAKGSASPKPKPNIPTIGANFPEAVDKPNNDATKFPVQLNDTITNVKAMKNIPE